MTRLFGVDKAGLSFIAPLRAMVTYRFKLNDIETAYELFANQRDGVLKIAITP